MNKNRLILYIVFAAFHLGAFIFTVMLPKILYNIFGWVPYFKWITLFGLLILVVDFIWARKATKDAANEKAALTLELNTLKAKLFDLQEDAKKQSAAKATDRS